MMGSGWPGPRRRRWRSWLVGWTPESVALLFSAPDADHRRAHPALAEVTDADTYPDRRAWRRAQATAGPDEDIAAELERSAGRAQTRGGFAAAAAFLDRATELTPDLALRGAPALAAAQAKFDAAAPEL